MIERCLINIVICESIHVAANQLNPTVGPAHSRLKSITQSLLWSFVKTANTSALWRISVKVNHHYHKCFRSLMTLKRDSCTSNLALSDFARNENTCQPNSHDDKRSWSGYSGTWAFGIYTEPFLTA